LALAAERDELARPIMRGHPDLLAEAAFAARFEQARSVGDVLLRRTRLGLLEGRWLAAQGATEPVRVAEAMGPELGWDRLTVAQQATVFRSEAEAEGIALQEL
ncbi:MAG: hypothetical protein J2O48_11360, partial [Solirubrobacterales bacterium]|nr:hypothetical protein [Solirubrobacterales bacterium]